jgi:hypothetical protein
MYLPIHDGVLKFRLKLNGEDNLFQYLSYVINPNVLRNAIHFTTVDFLLVAKSGCNVV